MIPVFQSRCYCWRCNTAKCYCAFLLSNI